MSDDARGERKAPEQSLNAEDSCFWKHNPWTKVDACYSPDLALQYKRAMNLGIVTVILCFFGLVLEGICGFINWAGLALLIPVFKPYFGSGLNVLLWAFIAFSTFLLSFIGLFIGLSNECAGAALAVNGIIMVLQGLTAYVLMQIDPELKGKIKEWWQTAGCSLREPGEGKSKGGVAAKRDGADSFDEV
mmetsp:Transcript_6767/g.7774  ORF Transcript_6767/g.7774 Transcript_6767/m.7774 type:complete len:189 (-) Transcript_6767:1555-2121(-)|eukprot:CAMPEP_0184056072 /NCGR_PEP_ID=MMETSP0956-20121227/7558_1 /TAXON_ID=627963 /ORGANISM="Aplanochytrium sp, Strain PBS07" /LENGTH=188 /DNA_ID=CAMNT_0026350025 /DNA_START=114 /DNA_END=680 /DNA_ORIENTATION=-